MADQMNQQREARSGSLPTQSSGETGSTVQLQQEIAGMPYSRQVERLRPPMPAFGPSSVQSKPAQGVQLSGNPGEQASQIKTAASSGISGSSTSLPHADRIQQSFGPYDVSGIKAHVGSTATRASASMGAQAYTTGDHVAFKGSPDLHTAAHEAAHVFQQSKGVSLDHGVGKVGDSYEKHADRVADTVVSGGSAAPLLAQMAPVQGIFEDSVQLLHGEDRPVGAAYGGDGTTTVSSALGAMDAARGGEAAGFTRDANWNNAKKAEFESKLAARILGQCQDVYNDVVLRVSGSIMSYLEKRVEVTGQDMNDQLRKLGTNLDARVFKSTGNPNGVQNDVFFGRVKNFPDEFKYSLAHSIKMVLQGEGTIPQQMYAQHQFMDQFYDGDYTSGVAQQIITMAQEGTDKVEKKWEVIKPKSMREGVTSEAGGTTVTDVFGTQSTTGVGGRDKRGRSAPGKAGSRVQDEFGQPRNPSIAQASGIQERPEQSSATGSGPVDLTDLPSDVKAQAHSRGVDLQTMDEEQEFIQQARLILDMPLAGAISGTTADLLEVAKTFGVAGQDLQLYAMAILGHLESAGAHSFHEIATASQTAGLPYTPGDYRSFLHPSILARCEDLFTEYAEWIKPLP